MARVAQGGERPALCFLLGQALIYPPCQTRYKKGTLLCYQQLGWKRVVGGTVVVGRVVRDLSYLL